MLLSRPPLPFHLLPALLLSPPFLSSPLCVMDGVGQHVSSDSDSLCQLFSVWGPQCFPSFPPQLYRRSFQVIDLKEVREECYLLPSHFRPEETGDLILRDGTASGYRLGFCYSKSCSLQLFPVFPEQFTLTPVRPTRPQSFRKNANLRTNW